MVNDTFAMEQKFNPNLVGGGMLVSAGVPQVCSSQL